MEVDRDQEHKLRLTLVKRLPEDYQPYGNIDRWESDQSGDCSGGCRHARWLHDPRLGKDTDWCVCLNPASHRAGLLTFEHQGCRHFERGVRLNAAQLIAVIGWESQIPSGYLPAMSTDDLHRALEILEQPDRPDTSERERQLSRYTESAILQELDRRNAAP